MHLHFLILVYFSLYVLHPSLPPSLSLFLTLSALSLLYS